MIGIVAGTVGSFGGMSIAAGLCTRLIVTPQARIGLNGPAVIEQEGGIDEFDSSDHALIWAVDGGEQRYAIGLADALVPDDADLLRAAVSTRSGPACLEPGRHRSQRLDVLASRLGDMIPAVPPTLRDLRALWGSAYEPIPRPRRARSARRQARQRHQGPVLATRAQRDTPPSRSSLRSFRSTTPGPLSAVVPDPDNRFYRAREGQVGVTESLALAQAVRDLVDADRRRDEAGDHRRRRPPQPGLRPLRGDRRSASGDGGRRRRVSRCARVRAPHRRPRRRTALSGGFLTHGLQANQILALDDPGVEIHAMHKAAAARITLRTVDELDELAKTILPMSYDVEDWAKLGFCDGLLKVDDAEPRAPDVETVSAAISTRSTCPQRTAGPVHRLDSDAAVTTRRASRAVRELLARQWNSEP